MTFGSGGLQFLPQPATNNSQQLSNMTSPNGGSVYSSQVWRNFEEKETDQSGNTNILSRQTSKLNLTADFPNEEEIDNCNDEDGMIGSANHEEVSFYP